MGWEEYIDVRNSDLYDGKGLAKPVLSLIAHLVIGSPEENEQGKPKSKPDPDVGWCVATEDYLAMSLGCSEAQVSRLVGIFEVDGWLEVKRFRDKNGRRRNHYRLLGLDEIKARKTQRDDRGRFIREKNLSKRRDGLRSGTGRYIRMRVGQASMERTASPAESVKRFSLGNVQRTEKPKPLGAESPSGSERSGQPESSGEPTRYVRQAVGFQQVKTEGTSVRVARAHSSSNGAGNSNHSRAVKPDCRSKGSVIFPVSENPPPGSAGPLPLTPKEVAIACLWCKQRERLSGENICKACSDNYDAQSERVMRRRP